MLTRQIYLLNTRKCFFDTLYIHILIYILREKEITDKINRYNNIWGDKKREINTKEIHV